MNGPIFDRSKGRIEISIGGVRSLDPLYLSDCYVGVNTIPRIILCRFLPLSYGTTAAFASFFWSARGAGPLIADLIQRSTTKISPVLPHPLFSFLARVSIRLVTPRGFAHRNVSHEHFASFQRVVCCDRVKGSMIKFLGMWCIATRRELPGTLGENRFRTC